jgi:parallel beta-helix repeat protein
VKGNFVNGKPLIYLEDVSNALVDDAGQVILVNWNDIQVENLNLSNATVGAELLGTTNFTVAANNIANNYYGIYLSFSSEPYFSHSSYYL